MRVLVTGGTGFIGSHVCDALLARNHQVRVYSRSPEESRAPLPGVEYYTGNMEDTFHLSEALTDTDVVIHLVSSTVPGTSNLDPVADIESNLSSTVRMLDVMRQAGPRRIVYLSSGGTVYGEPSVLPVPETASLNPRCSYGVVKIAIEHYLSMYQALYGLEPIVLRPSNPFGPRQGRLGVQGIISAFLNRMKAQQPLSVWGDGTVVRDYFYVADLAELCAVAAESSATGVFNAGSGRGASINDVIELISRVTGIDAQVNYGGQRNFDVGQIYLDISRARAELGWEPKISLEEGIEHHWRWLTQFA